MSKKPLINVDVYTSTWMGITRRMFVIFGVTGVLALAILFFWGELEIGVRIPLALVVGGLGLALAIGRIGLLTPEAWFLEVLWYRGKRRVFELNALKAERESKFQVTREEPMAPAPASKGSARPTPPVAAPRPVPSYRAPRRPAIHLLPRIEPDYSFFVLVLNAVGLALVVGVGFYLLQGGAAYLSALLN